MTKQDRVSTPATQESNGLRFRPERNGFFDHHILQHPFGRVLIFRRSEGKVRYSQGQNGHNSAK